MFATKGIMEKSKLLEMSFKLAPIAAKMNFNSPDVLNLQIAAIKMIRSCCDIIANNVGNEKKMHVGREVTGSVGRVSLRG